MNIPLDEVLHFGVTTRDPATGSLADADSTPTWSVYEEDTDTAIQSGNMTKRTSLDGRYRGSNTLSAANGYEVGKFYEVHVSATVEGVSDSIIAKSFRCVAAEAATGKAPATLAAADVSGNLPANVLQFGGQNGTFSGGRPTAIIADESVGAIRTLFIVTIGSSGNTTTTLDLGTGGPTYASGELTGLLLKFHDQSSNISYLRWIESWDGSLATVAALPVTPQDDIDSVEVFLIRRDVNAVQISGSTTAADNLEVVYDTDFGTAYDTALDRWIVEANVSSINDTVITASKFGTGAITADAFATDAVNEIRDAIIAQFVDDLGTAQAGGASTITLRSGASNQDDAYEFSVVKTTGGTGAGQTRQITGYVGSTRVATVDVAWIVQPDNTTTYIVLGRIV